ncbi:MAG: 50S ribosomal protein L11 methyltransferase, partial [Bacteriovoracaceae bacterium]
MTKYSIPEGQFIEIVVQNKKDLLQKFSLDELNEKLEIDGILEGEVENPDKLIEGNEEFSEVDGEFKDAQALKKDQFVFYFFEDDYESKAKNLESLFTEVGLSYERIVKSAEDWNETWKEHYKPIDLGDGYGIIPSHLIESNHGIDLEKSILIEPGQGFGTGEHETTFLCLQRLIKRERKEGETALDFGCGSGILGVAAIKWRNIVTDFMDIDTRALDNCVKNIALNFNDETDLSSCGVYSRETFDPNQKYDLVFANILEHVILKESDVLLSLLKEGAELMVSGILNTQAENIL